MFTPTVQAQLRNVFVGVCVGGKLFSLPLQAVQGLLFVVGTLSIKISIAKALGIADDVGQSLFFDFLYDSLT